MKFIKFIEVTTGIYWGSVIKIQVAMKLDININKIKY